MKKYIKIVLIPVLAIVLPFVLLRVIIECPALIGLSEIILYLYPIYLPVFCGYFGVTLYKVMGKILLPISIFNLFLIFCTHFLTEMIFDAIDRSLASVLVGVLLVGPLFYSVPVSFIAPAIYKHRQKKAKAQKNNETQV